MRKAGLKQSLTYLTHRSNRHAPSGLGLLSILRQTNLLGCRIHGRRLTLAKLCVGSRDGR
jgi:hypothetical protein